MTRLSKIFLAFIIILAFLLRFYKVAEVPPALNWDETSIAYNAYSILKTGHDEWGEFLPIHFKSYGEYKLPTQIYFSIPGIALFGLNEFGVRVTPVIYGTLTVLFLYFLIKEFSKNQKIALVGAFFLAISPWHIHLTRASFESSFSVLWVVLGIWFFIKGFKDEKWFLIAMIPFAISMYTYNSARVFTPLFLLIAILTQYKFFLKQLRITFLILVFFSVLLLPLIPFYLSGEGNARYKLVSVTDDPGLIPRINERRGNSTLPNPLPRLVHNKVTYVTTYTLQHYLAHFSPDFLFISGAPHKQHHVQNIGQMYLFQFPLIALGLYYLFKKKYQFRWLLISWISIAFIPVSITNDSIPHALRTVIAAPAYLLLAALGVYFIYQWLIQKKALLKYSVVFISSIVLVISIYTYLYQYFVVYPKEYSRDWQYGYKQVVEYIGSNYDHYDQIVFTRHYGEPHIFTLFYLEYDPSRFQNNPNLNRFETYDWVRVLNFDKFYFPDLGDQGTKYQDIVASNPNKKLLFIGKPGDFPSELPRLQQVYFLNGSLAFEVVEYNI